MIIFDNKISKLIDTIHDEYFVDLSAIIASNFLDNWGKLLKTCDRQPKPK